MNGPFSNAVRRLAIAVAVYPCWLAMMAVHELGHVLHAWLSGGQVAAVHVPLVGFSITSFASNPHPHFVTWGGPVWGSVLPLALWGLVEAVGWKGRRWVQLFAGFCLVANGAYLGVGWTMRAGDAADLVRRGTPVWVLATVGFLLCSAGLYLWHALGSGPSPRPSPPSTGERG